jgi:hypothetical protein
LWSWRGGDEEEKDTGPEVGASIVGDKWPWIEVCAAVVGTVWILRLAGIAKVPRATGAVNEYGLAHE